MPPKKPAKDTDPEAVNAYQQTRHTQSPTRICVKHATADSKNWRPLQRWIGRREHDEETILAIGSLVSDHAATQ